MVSVEQGKSTFLFCLADGSPEPSYQWLRNGDRVPDEWIEQTVDGTRLKIVVEADNSVHSGTYTCRCDNVAGTTEQNFNIEIV